MGTSGPGNAEIVDVLHTPDDREDDVRRDGVGSEGDRCAHGEADCGEEEENPSGCRPVASHQRNGRSGSRSKGRTVPSVSVSVTPE